jgi:hypothetical protein
MEYCESNVWVYEILDWVKNASNELEKLDWYRLSGNPNAIHLLEKNQEKIVWRYLSDNPNAMHLLEKNQEKIYCNALSGNPSIFKKTINYGYLYQRMNIIREEMMMRCMHPSRLERWIEMGGDIDDF